MVSFSYYAKICQNRRGLKKFAGKSTRPLLNKNTNEMIKEAKRLALIDFFKHVYGYTDTNDIAVDELYRPQNS